MWVSLSLSHSRHRPIALRAANPRSRVTYSVESAVHRLSYRHLNSSTSRCRPEETLGYGPHHRHCPRVDLKPHISETDRHPPPRTLWRLRNRALQTNSGCFSQPYTRRRRYGVTSEETPPARNLQGPTPLAREESGTHHPATTDIDTICPSAYYQGRSTEPRDSNLSVYVYVNRARPVPTRRGREPGTLQRRRFENARDSPRRGPPRCVPRMGRSSSRIASVTATLRMSVCWSFGKASAVLRDASSSPPHAEERESGHASPYIGS